MPRLAVKTLSAEEERELTALARAGDESARHRVIEGAMPAVKALARKRAKGDDIAFDDIVATGYLALVEAFERFEPERGMRFLTYAMFYVRKLVGLHIMAAGHVARFGHSQAEKNAYFMFVRENGEGRTVTAAQLSAHTSLPVDRCQELIDLLSRTDVGVVMVSPSEDGHSHERMLVDNDSMAPDEVVERLEDMRRVRRVLVKMDARKLQVLERRAMADEPEHLAVIGADWGVCRERVRQIEALALETVRKRLAG